MATITEDYANFETAKLLKDKGFDEPCFCINYPLPEGGHRNIILQNLLNNSMIPFTDEYKFCRYKEDFITIPTLQMAMKWLREVHNLYIWIGHIACKSLSWYFEIHRISDGKVKHIGGIQCGSYEVACEAAIKHCLENLI